MTTTHEKLLKIARSNKHAQGVEQYKLKTHVIIYNLDTDSGYALCHEEKVEEAFAFLKEAGADYICAYELGKTAYAYNVLGE